MITYTIESDVSVADFIMPAILISGLVIFAIVLCTIFFRSLIIGNALYGTNQEKSIKQFMKSQTLVDRLFMTYIWKFSLEKKQNLGFVIWFLICHFIHIASSLVFLFWIWYEGYLFLSSERGLIFEFYVLGMRITHGNVFETLFTLIIASLPVSILLSIPFTVFLKRNKDKDTGTVHLSDRLPPPPH